MRIWDLARSRFPAFPELAWKSTFQFLRASAAALCRIRVTLRRVSITGDHDAFYLPSMSGKSEIWQSCPIGGAKELGCAGLEKSSVPSSDGISPGRRIEFRSSIFGRARWTIRPQIALTLIFATPRTGGD